MEGGFGSDFGSSGGGKLDPGLIMEQVKVQIAVANAQELLQRMTDKCFRKCIGKPGGSLDNSEQTASESQYQSTQPRTEQTPTSAVSPESTLWLRCSG
ncbi:mitochondrial import inner membrane translocase subunit Tim13 isoform X1 [Neophocaena asiaeorientalis asiaeorientalis]|uniref:Mitochondrial import inner membrane translocase subunit n=1 Tax=Neophocaena asiaeorientalis asiaeorientalis TaxID=1706337 RepID=A0A341B2E1_NEOAA|nr:mitochondrial import inner membrane translocase subunit Tim13 isoform X1 [Neophocaena asiaeorientalis asiaeorientalis]XP_032481178.1 mitochondrial import inner membrane translocase subunit Tim13 isoform X1 [Phocoena sinus]